MNRIVISKETNPCYNLALEEELLKQADSGGTLLYLWVNRPCVVLGRNQNPYLECDMDYLESEGICLVRRKSGGGAVYQDLGNLNYTFINREGEGNREIQRQVLLGMLRSLGVEAAFCGRNDILVEGRKVSGQAGYCEGGNEYLHGTLMVRVDRERLIKSLRPSKLKLESKGVRSIAARVANLSEYILEIEIGQAVRQLADSFRSICGPSHPVQYRDEGQGRPSRQDIYESRDWIVDSCPEYTVRQEMQWEGGILKLRFQVKGGVILKTGYSCDSLTCGDISWIRELTGIRYDRGRINNIIMERGK